MRQFAGFVSDFQIVQTLSAQFSWSHNTLLLDKTKTLAEYMWYADRIIQEGLSLSVLETKIELKNYERQGIAEKTTNYSLHLPSPFSELAQETLKSPYVFDFVEKRDDIIEREIENELVANIVKTLLELGTGFAFVGNQYHLEVSGKDYYIDLLFYNTRLRCYVVIELKNNEFKPEYAGQLNFYLSAIDDMLKHPADNPSIGIMLCKTRDKLTAEYALKDINKPIDVSEYKLSDFVPPELIDTLPSAEDIEKRVKLKYDINAAGGGEDNE
jgi:predicted nuclease of restriction endonuclease-like (RecB) superfamily